MEKLGGEELGQTLAELPEWSIEAGSLVRDWRFHDFAEAMAFVNRVATLAEAEGHHPDIEICYNRVRVGLVTHDVGGITAKDAVMAGKLDRALNLSAE